MVGIISKLRHDPNIWCLKNEDRIVATFTKIYVVGVIRVNFDIHRIAFYQSLHTDREV